MRIETKRIEVTEDGVSKFEVRVNRKLQGIITNTASDSLWRLDRDSLNKTFQSSDEAVMALCERTGRKLKIKEKKKKK